MKVTHLELDRLRARLLPQSAHSEQDRDLTYRAMHLIAEHLLAGGQSAVLDATYGRSVQRTQLRELSTNTGSRLLLIQCRVSPDEAIRRFLNRTDEHFAVDLTQQRVRTLAEEYDYDADVILAEENTIEQSLEIIARYL